MPHHSFELDSPVVSALARLAMSLVTHGLAVCLFGVCSNASGCCVLTSTCGGSPKHYTRPFISKPDEKIGGIHTHTVLRQRCPIRPETGKISLSVGGGHSPCPTPPRVSA